jgi:hypothetical protein
MGEESGWEVISGVLVRFGAGSGSDDKPHMLLSSSEDSDGDDNRSLFLIGDLSWWRGFFLKMVLVVMSLSLRKSDSEALFRVFLLLALVLVGPPTSSRRLTRLGSILVLAFTILTCECLPSQAC